MGASGKFLGKPDREWGGAGFGCGEVGVMSSWSCAEVARAGSSAVGGQWRVGRGGWIRTNKNRGALPYGEAAGVPAQAVHQSGEVHPPRGPPIPPASQRMSCRPRAPRNSRALRARVIATKQASAESPSAQKDAPRAELP